MDSCAHLCFGTLFEEVKNIFFWKWICVKWKKKTKKHQQLIQHWKCHVMGVVVSVIRPNNARNSQGLQGCASVMLFIPCLIVCSSFWIVTWKCHSLFHKDLFHNICHMWDNNCDPCPRTLALFHHDASWSITTYSIDFITITSLVIQDALILKSFHFIQDLSSGVGFWVPENRAITNSVLLISSTLMHNTRTSCH